MSSFQFKQFEVSQDRCAMKVGTDGVLLGAWASGGKRILDIGSGTGLISLMMAQRFPEAKVVGIDIDEDACSQARENVCPNHCPGCHNPQSWDISHGTMTSTDELMKEIMSDPFANVTFSGGDPMFQAKGFAELARAIREQSSKSIWCFTGYLFENLVKNPEQLELLRQIDVLVDGPFVQALRDEDLFFRGSSNQRIINVQKSLKEGRIIELNLTTENPNPVL